MKNRDKPVEYNNQDYEYMSSLSSAILVQTPSRVSRVLKIWLVTIFLLILWASFAEIDEITRGDGDVIPYGQNQLIQNLEGGIIDAILVKEGQVVKKGEVILKINNAKSTSTSETNEMKFQELQAKRLRLFAEANQLKFEDIETTYPNLKTQIKLAKELYNSSKLEFLAKDN
ncbi:MAG: adhesin transport system membrane fusion protein, partial [Sulfurimonas sp.]